jgi:hypothetical protein
VALSRRCMILGVAAAATPERRTAWAQSADAAGAWPARTVRILCGFAPGGAADTIAPPEWATWTTSSPPASSRSTSVPSRFSLPARGDP